MHHVRPQTFEEINTFFKRWPIFKDEVKVPTQRSIEDLLTETQRALGASRDSRWATKQDTGPYAALKLHFPDQSPTQWGVPLGEVTLNAVECPGPDGYSRRKTFTTFTERGDLTVVTNEVLLRHSLEPGDGSIEQPRVQNHVSPLQLDHLARVIGRIVT